MISATKGDTRKSASFQGELHHDNQHPDVVVVYNLMSSTPRELVKGSSGLVQAPRSWSPSPAQMVAGVNACATSLVWRTPTLGAFSHTTTPVSSSIGMPIDNGLIVPSAIARSPCHNQSSRTLQQVLPLPSQSLAMFHLYPHLMPPVEEGEHCHICDQPAWGLTDHICWCRECALALLPNRNVCALLIVPKCALTMHAHLHANRWIRMVLRLIASQPQAAKSSYPTCYFPRNLL